MKNQEEVIKRAIAIATAKQQVQQEQQFQSNQQQAITDGIIETVGCSEEIAKDAVEAADNEVNGKTWLAGIPVLLGLTAFIWRLGGGPALDEIMLPKQQPNSMSEIVIEG